MPTASGRPTAAEKRERERLQRIALHDKWAEEYEAAHPGLSDDRAWKMLTDLAGKIAAGVPSYEQRVERQFEADVEYGKDLLGESMARWALVRALERRLGAKAEGPRPEYMIVTQTSFGIGAGRAATRFGVEVSYWGKR